MTASKEDDKKKVNLQTPGPVPPKQENTAPEATPPKKAPKKESPQQQQDATPSKPKKQEGGTQESENKNPNMAMLDTMNKIVSDLNGMVTDIAVGAVKKGIDAAANTPVGKALGGLANAIKGAAGRIGDQILDSIDQKVDDFQKNTKIGQGLTALSNAAKDMGAKFDKAVEQGEKSIVDAINNATNKINKIGTDAPEKEADKDAEKQQNQEPNIDDEFAKMQADMQQAGASYDDVEDVDFELDDLGNSADTPQPSPSMAADDEDSGMELEAVGKTIVQPSAISAEALPMDMDDNLQPPSSAPTPSQQPAVEQESTLGMSR